MYMCTPVAGSPGVRWSVSVDHHTSQLEGALWSCCYNFITRSEEEQQVHDRSNSRIQVLGRGDHGLAATELRLNIYDNCARSRCQANSSGDSGWAATAMHMQGQANCPLDEPPDPCRRTAEAIEMGGYRQCQANSSGVCHLAETERRSKEWPLDLYLLAPWDCRWWSWVDLGTNRE